MKKVIFRSSIIYYLAITYSILIAMAYILIAKNKVYFIAGNMTTPLLIDFLFNNSILGFSLASIFFLIRKSRKAIFCLNVCITIFSVILLMRISNHYRSNEEISYLYADIIALIFNVFFLFLINKFKLKDFSHSEINDIDKKE